MTIRHCPREAETIRRAWSGGQGNSELSRHVAGCASCAEAATLAQVFRAEREADCAEALVPSPGLIWWKAELQRRRERARAASQPIVLAWSAAACALLAAALALAAPFVPPSAASARQFMNWLEGLGALPGLGPAILAQPGVLLVAAAALALAPVALYLACSRD